MPADTSRARLVLAFLCIYLVWGTTFYVIAVGLRFLPPFTLVAARFLIAGTLLYLWLRQRDSRPFAGLPTARVVLAGVLFSGINNGFITWAQQGVPSGTVALIVASIPICVLALDWSLFSRQAPARHVVAGMLIAGIGVTLVIAQTHSFRGQTGLIYLAAVLIAMLSWSIATLLQRGLVPPGKTLAFASAQMLCGGTFALLLSVGSAEWREVSAASLSWPAIAAVLYLSLAGSVLAQSCYFWLLTRVRPYQATTYALVNPVVALFLGVWLLDEILTIGTSLSALLVLIGIAVVLFAHRRWLGLGVLFDRVLRRRSSPREPSAKAEACIERP
jgi:drug/metabolite transporter (DMT)-like permease